MAGPMGRFIYNSDDGGQYAVRLDAGNAASVGAASPGGPLPSPPRGYRLRYVLAQGPNGRERRIVVTDPAAGIWVGGTGTISLPDYNALAAANFTIRGRVGEKRYDR